MSRFTRTNFLNKETIDNIQEYDLLMTNFEYFKIQRPTTFYIVTNDDLGRPDLLSLRIYGDQNYWWILLEVNGVCDPYNELKEGDVLIVPSLLDIEDFYLKVRNL